MGEIAPAGMFPRGAIHAPVLRPISGTRYDAVVPAYTSFIKGSITDQVFGYDRLLEALSPLKGKRILDYGCGPGVFAHQLGYHGANVTGVDISSESIAQANRSFPPDKFPELTFQAIRSGDLSEIKTGYDAAVVNFVLSTMPRRDLIVDVLKSIRGALKPGGQLLILESNWERSNGREFQSFELPEVRPLVSGCEVIPTLKSDSGSMALRLQDYYWSHDDIRLMLREAGFDLEKIDEPTASESDDRPWMDEKTHPPTVIFHATARPTAPSKPAPATSDFTDADSTPRALVALG